MPSSPGYKRDYKLCKSCGEEFETSTKQRKFCSTSCKGSFKYVSGRVTTDSQYEGIPGNWERYLSRLLYFAGRKRDLLTREILLKKLVFQNYRCALSGLELTCNLKRGQKFPFNASIDRVEAGGPYSEDNIQIVCQSLNHWRADTSIEDFIKVCTAVAEHNKEKTVAIQ